MTFCTPRENNNAVPIEDISGEEVIVMDTMLAVTADPAIEGFRFNGIVVANVANARTGPGMGNDVKVKYPLGKRLRISRQSDERDVLNLGNNTGCDSFGYFWYEIDDRGEWVYGEFIFEVIEHEELSSSPINIYGRTYYLGIARETSYGASDNDGLTGCDEDAMLFIYERGTVEVYPILANDMLNSEWRNFFKQRYDSKLLLITINSEGGSTSIEQVDVSGNDIIIRFNNGYQDGSGESRLWIKKQNQNFVIAKHEDTPRDGFAQ